MARTRNGLALIGAIVGGYYGGSAGAVMGRWLGGQAEGGDSDPNTTQIADPFASERPRYQGQLRNVMANPGDIASHPFYSFARDQGLGAVNSSLGARGLLGSGSRLTELTDYATGSASRGFTSLAGILAGLSGSTVGSPGEAARLAQAQAQYGASSDMQMAGLVNDGIRGWQSNRGNGGDTDMTGFRIDPYAPGNGGDTDMTGFRNPTPEF